MQATNVTHIATIITTSTQQFLSPINNNATINYTNIDATAGDACNSAENEYQASTTLLQLLLPPPESRSSAVAVASVAHPPHSLTKHWRSWGGRGGGVDEV